jgi:hypothetical protein
LLDDVAVVSWVEEVGEGAELRARTVAPGRQAEASAKIADVSAARSSGFARMAVARGAALIAWTDVDAGTVRVARLSR